MQILEQFDGTIEWKAKRRSVICIGTLLMVPQAGARDRMVQSVVINFSSKVYSKSLVIKKIDSILLDIGLPVLRMRNVD